MFVLIVALTVLVVVHELGHALAARLCGGRVRRLCIGFGPFITGFRVRGVAVEIRAVQGLGRCEIEDPQSLGSRRLLAVAIGGPIASMTAGIALIVSGLMLAGNGMAESLLVAIRYVFSVPIGYDTVRAGVDVSGIGDTTFALVLFGALNVWSGWINLMPMAPLDGWLILINGLESLGLKLIPERVEQMARASNGVLVAIVAMWASEWLPAGSEKLVIAMLVGTMVLWMWIGWGRYFRRM